MTLSTQRESISAAHLETFRRNGYCILKDALAPEECAGYIAESEKITQGQTERYAPVMNPDRTHPAFRSLLCHPTVVRSAEKILDSKICALQSMFYFKPPGQLGRDMHQDNFYAQSERDAYLGTWLALEASDRENGGLVVYPRSHHEPLLDIVPDESRRETNIGGFQNDRGMPCKIPAGYEKVYLAVPTGAVVFIHGHLIHGSEENLSRHRFRRVFAGHYLRLGAPFRPGEHANRTVIDVYSP